MSPTTPYPQIIFGLLAFQYSFETYLSLRQLQHLSHDPSAPPPKLTRFLALLDQVRELDAERSKEKSEKSKTSEQEADESKKAKETDENDGLNALQTFAKSQAYAKDKIYFSIISGLISLLLNGFLLLPLFGGKPFFTQLYLDPPLHVPSFAIIFLRFIRALPLPTSPVYSEIISTLNFFLSLMPLTLVISYPIGLLKTFWLEQKYGFNKSTFKLWVKDEIVSLALTFAMGTPILVLAVRIMRWAWGEGGREIWWVGGTEGGIIAIQILFLILYPVLIAPLFNKFTPLPADSPLTSQLNDLAKRVNFPLGKLWVCDSSKRSSHSNAFFYGVPFLTKHIVLFDTLIEKNSTEEVLAVLGHELGHFKMRHNISLLLTTDTYLLLLLILFTTSVQSSSIFESFGFPPSSTSAFPIVIGFMLAQDVFGPLDCLAHFTMNFVSRKFEFEADEFAKNLGYAEELKRGLVRIGAGNMGVTDCDSWWSAYHHSHPTLGERISKLDLPSKSLKKE